MTSNCKFAAVIAQTTFLPGIDICVSPKGICDILRMLKLGARNDTDIQLYALLSNVIRTNTLNTFSSSKLYIDKQLPSPVLTDIRQIDFTNPSMALGEINNWINQKTKGNIQKIVRNIPNDTLIAAVNIVYFKETWNNCFKTISDQPFTKQDGTTIWVPMMTTDGYFAIKTDHDWNLRVICIPYTNNCNLYVIQSLNNALVRLDAFNSWSQNMEMCFLRLNLPTFRINTELDLKNVFPDLDLFNVDKCDLTGFTEDNSVTAHVSIARHSVVVDVSATSTEAASAHMFEQAPCTVEFTVDKPFTYVIVDNDNCTMLFAGQFSGSAYKN